MSFNAFFNNKHFAEIFDYASIGILITDDTGVILLVNKYLQHQFGYPEDELVGHKIEKLIPPKVRDRHIKHRERHVKDPHSRPMGLGMELAGVKKDGSEIPVEVSLGHYANSDDKYSIAFVTDISQRKETEIAIQQLNKHLEQQVKEGTQSLAITVKQLSAQIKETERKDTELERANNFLSNIWNHAGAIIIVTDITGIIRLFNPTAESALGYNAAEVIDIHTPSIFHVQEEIDQRAEELSTELNMHIEADFEVFAIKARLRMENEFEWHYVRKDGTQFYVSLNVTALKDKTGEVTGFLGLAIDISDKKRAEAELRAALEKEKELNELKSRFVSMASHEFRTPLSSVLSSAYLLSKYVKAEEQPQRDKHIQRIVSSVSSLTEILNDFLSVGKIEEGKVNARFTEYDLEKQVNDMVHEMNHMLKKGMTITYNHLGPSIVSLDASMVKHVMLNLLSNAIKFSPENSMIELTTEQNEKKLILSIKDQGIGIPKDDQEHLFKRFYRSTNASDIQGTGLGLHIVRKYVELMGGNIECFSEIGTGTEFVITF